MSATEAVPFWFILSTVAVIMAVIAVGVWFVRRHPKAKQRKL